jgi:hypothetical protein
VVPEGEGGEGARGRPFVAKAMNIQDPLLYYNNLGRSVSKGTRQETTLHLLHRAILEHRPVFAQTLSYLLSCAILFTRSIRQNRDTRRLLRPFIAPPCHAAGNLSRIRTALKKGAATLHGILTGPPERLLPELDRFFANTWRRHGAGPRPDVGEDRRKARQEAAAAHAAAQQARVLASMGLRGYLGGTWPQGVGEAGAGVRYAGGTGYPEVGAPFSMKELAEAARGVAQEGRGSSRGGYMQNGNAHAEAPEEEGDDAAPLWRVREEGREHAPGLHKRSTGGDASRGGAAGEQDLRLEREGTGHASGAELGMQRGEAGPGPERAAFSDPPPHQRPARADGRQGSLDDSQPAESRLQRTPRSSPRAGASFGLPFDGAAPFPSVVSGSVVEGVPVPFYSALPRGAGTGAFLPSPELPPASLAEPATGLPYWQLAVASPQGRLRFAEGPPRSSPAERGPASSSEGLPKLVGSVPIPIVTPEGPPSGPPSPRGGSYRPSPISPPFFPLARTPPARSGRNVGPASPSSWEPGYPSYHGNSPGGRLEGLSGAASFPPPLHLPDPASSSGAEEKQAGMRRSRGAAGGHSEQGRSMGTARHFEGNSRNGPRERGQGAEQQMGRQGELAEQLMGGMHAGALSLSLPNGGLSWGPYSDPRYQYRQLLANGYVANGQLFNPHLMYIPFGFSSPHNPGSGEDSRGPTLDRALEEELLRSGDRAGGRQEEHWETGAEGRGKTAGPPPEGQSPGRKAGGDAGGSRAQAREQAHEAGSPRHEGLRAQTGRVAPPLERKGSMERAGKGALPRQEWVAKTGDDGAAQHGGGGGGQGDYRGDKQEGTGQRGTGDGEGGTGTGTERSGGQVSYSDVEMGPRGGPSGRRRASGHRRQSSEGSVDFLQREASLAAALAEMNRQGGGSLPNGPPALAHPQLLLSPSGTIREAGAPTTLVLPPSSPPSLPAHLFLAQRGAHHSPGEEHGESGGRPHVRQDPRSAPLPERVLRSGGARDEDLVRQELAPPAADPVLLRSPPSQRMLTARSPYPSNLYPPSLSLPFPIDWEAAFSLGPSLGLPVRPAPPPPPEAPDLEGPPEDEDLLRGDLEAHLRSLDFGRHCQMQVDRGQKWQPPLPPPQPQPGQYWNPPSGAAPPQQKGQPRSGPSPPHMYGPTLRSPQGGPAAPWQQQQHKFSGKGQRTVPSAGLHRPGEDAFRQQRGAEGRAPGTFVGPGGRLYMPQGQGVGVHFLEGEARQPADVFNRGGMVSRAASVRVYQSTRRS